MISKTDVSSAGGAVIVRVKQRDDVSVVLTFTEARELHEQLGRVLARDDRRTALRTASKERK